MKRKPIILFILVIAILSGVSVYWQLQPRTPSYLYEIIPTPCGPFKTIGQNLSWTPGACDAGHRFRICFTVTDLSSQTATTCHSFNVRGACTSYTADINMDNKTNISDLVLVATHFGQLGTNLQADLYGGGQVTLQDLACVAKYFGTSL